MKNMTLNKLKEMYGIYSPSGKEKPMRAYVQSIMDSNGIKYREYAGSLYNLIPGTPMLSAHMDQVHALPCLEAHVQGDRIEGDGNLGADDKNGLWIALKLLSMPKFKNKVSFIFTVDEEVGAWGAKDMLNKFKKDIGQCLYGIVLDRKGGRDIIGTKNNYCTADFEKAVRKVGLSFGYHAVSGVFSDADVWSDTLSCVNVSVGYENAHTESEYTSIPALYNAFHFVNAVLSSVTDNFKPPKKRPVPKKAVVKKTAPKTKTFKNLKKTVGKKSINDVAWEKYTNDDIINLFPMPCPVCTEDSDLISGYNGHDLECLVCGTVYDESTGDVITYPTNWE